jgi:hypothetical protein
VNKEPEMKYILITPQGRVRQFYILATAELYHALDGGTLITEPIYTEVCEELLVDNKSGS